MDSFSALSDPTRSALKEAAVDATYKAAGAFFTLSTNQPDAAEAYIQTVYAMDEVSHVVDRCLDCGNTDALKLALRETGLPAALVGFQVFGEALKAAFEAPSDVETNAAVRTAALKTTEIIGNQFKLPALNCSHVITYVGAQIDAAFATDDARARLDTAGMRLKTPGSFAFASLCMTMPARPQGLSCEVMAAMAGLHVATAALSAAQAVPAPSAAPPTPQHFKVLHPQLGD